MFKNVEINNDEIWDMIDDSFDLDEYLVKVVWHHKVEDNEPWDFCAGVLEYQRIKISPQELKKRFQGYFKKITGIKPFTKCPCCQSELRPRVSRWGYFVGCSGYPSCEFKATRSKRFSAKDFTVPKNVQ